MKSKVFDTSIAPDDEGHLIGEYDLPPEEAVVKVWEDLKGKQRPDRDVPELRTTDTDVRCGKYRALLKEEDQN